MLLVGGEVAIEGERRRSGKRRRRGERKKKKKKKVDNEVVRPTRKSDSVSHSIHRRIFSRNAQKKKKKAPTPSLFQHEGYMETNKTNRLA